MSSSQVMRAPRHVDIAITGQCNLACAYCFYADEMVSRDDLPTERWLAFFDELGSLGVMTVCLTGGEVFTRRDLFVLIDRIIANRMRYSVLSNGTLITEDVLAQFNLGKRRQRLDYIQISIDGSQAQVHDKSRPNSFQRAIRGVHLLRKAGFPVTARVTVNRYNVNDLESIAQLLLEEVGLPSFSTNEAFPCGVTERIGREVIMTRRQREKAMWTLADLEKRYPGRINATAGPLAKARAFATMEAALLAGHTRLPGCGVLGSCGGVFSRLAVLQDGTIVPCHNLSTLSMGTIGIDDLRKVWLEHPLLNAVRQRRNIPLDSLETCRDCSYQGFCTGGCPGGALFLTGKLNARNPLDCYRVLKGEDPYYTLDTIAKQEWDGDNRR